jgi:hypothetical protein
VAAYTHTGLPRTIGQFVAAGQRHSLSPLT